MKKLILLAAVAALAACNQKAEETPMATDTAMADATPMADASVTPGTYDVKSSDGKMGTTTINADGTYVDTDDKGKEMKGMYARKDGKDCFTPEGGAEECWSVTPPAADGSFTATAADGKTTVTVTPHMDAMAATPAPAAT